jgi:hypothetical protein
MTEVVESVVAALVGPGDRVNQRIRSDPKIERGTLGGMTPGNEPERTPELRSKSLENGVELPDFEVEKADFEVEKTRKRGSKGPRMAGVPAKMVGNRGLADDPFRPP